MELLGKVRRMFHRDKLSRSEIARRTGLSRNTVKKWLQAAEGATPKYRRHEAPGKLSAFHEALLRALEADAEMNALTWCGSVLSAWYNSSPLFTRLSTISCWRLCVHRFSPKLAPAKWMM